MELRSHNYMYVSLQLIIINGGTYMLGLFYLRRCYKAYFLLLQREWQSHDLFNIISWHDTYFLLFRIKSAEHIRFFIIFESKVKTKKLEKLFQNLKNANMKEIMYFSTYLRFYQILFENQIQASTNCLIIYIYMKFLRIYCFCF